MSHPYSVGFWSGGASLPREGLEFDVFGTRCTAPKTHAFIVDSETKAGAEGSSPGNPKQAEGIAADKEHLTA